MPRMTRYFNFIRRLKKRKLDSKNNLFGRAGQHVCVGGGRGGRSNIWRGSHLIFEAED